MTDEPPLSAPLDRRTLGGLLVLCALAVLSCATTFGNRFVQDDIGIIMRDEGIHRFSLSRIFLEPYWPAPFFRDLYRPLASTLFAAEWWVGGGSPITFRILSVTLYVLCTIACFALARRLLPRDYAWGIAALFAVHPVHVEAVAVGVNQGELLVGLMLALMTTWYIERRQSGPLTWRSHLFVAGVMLMGGFVKEHAVVLPALLLLTEFVLLRKPTSFVERLKIIRPTLILCTLALVLLVWPRAYLFQDDLRGSFTAEALLGLTMPQRLMTMLQVVPRWIYLIIWPAHLQADYSPQVIVAAKSFGVEQFGGVALLGLLLWVALRTVRDYPAIFFGIAFAGLTLLPVSNVLFPTGIVLAERTLFAPSLGALIALGGLACAMGGRIPVRWRPRQLMLGLVELLVVMGAIRSISRHMKWHDPLTLAIETVQDAPLSYRAWYGLGAVYLEMGRVEEGRKMIMHAIDFSPMSTPLYFSLADSYRERDECDKAIPVYQRGISIKAYDLPRAGLIACQLWLGHYPEGRAVALDGIRTGEDGKLFRTWLRLADSAIKVNAPPRTMRFPDTLRTTSSGRP